MKNQMRFVTRLDLGILGRPDSTELWTEITNHIPDNVLLKPGVKILSVACGHCTEAVILAKRMIGLGIPKDQVNDSIYLIDKYMMFTNAARMVYGFKNIINEDFLTWKNDMQFDVVIGNPPYANNDTERQDTNHRGQGKNLAKSFALKMISLSSRFSAIIMPYGHRTYSTNTQKIYQRHGLYKIYPCSEHFTMVSTNPCVFLFDKEVTAAVDNHFNNHEYSIPANNIGKLFHNQPGKLNRIDYEHTLTDSGLYNIVVTTNISKYTDSLVLVQQLADPTIGNWRVVFNCTTSIGKFGKIIIVGPEVTLSKSVHCLIVDDESSAVKMKQYLETVEVTKILAKVKLNSCNSKKIPPIHSLPKMRQQSYEIPYSKTKSFTRDLLDHSY